MTIPTPKYLTNLKRNLDNLPKDTLCEFHDELWKDYTDANEQWKHYCELGKKGFDHLPEWEQETAEKNCTRRRHFWYLRQECAWNSLQSYEDCTIAARCREEK